METSSACDINRKGYGVYRILTIAANNTTGTNSDGTFSTNNFRIALFLLPSLLPSFFMYNKKINSYDNSIDYMLLITRMSYPEILLQCEYEIKMKVYFLLDSSVEAPLRQAQKEIDVICMQVTKSYSSS